jgi:acetolactate synthase-1/2/3 large subunit
MQKEHFELPSGARLFVQHEGDGDELVLFLHAVGGDHSSWDRQIEALSGKYTCASFDFRGHGKSTFPGVPEQSDRLVHIPAFAEDAIELIDKLGYKRAHLVGLSMGGVVALEMFLQQRSVVQSLTLANTWSYHSQGEARIAFIEEKLAKKKMPDCSAELLPGLFAPGTSKEMIDAAIAIEGSKDSRVFLASWRSMFRVHYGELLHRIDVPMLLIGGTEDQVTPTDPLLTEIAHKVPMAQLVNIQGGGHFSNLDHSKEFNRALRLHLMRARTEESCRMTIRENTKSEFPANRVAHALMGLLSRRGVECFFSNSGTDFTPIIDALSRYQSDPDFKMKTIVAPHENTAIAMAHGHFLLSKRPQAVMAHVNVGTANMGLGIINASRSRIPMFVMAGKSPLYESDHEGCRTNFVQWGQDTFDQGAYFREFTKWDYELRGPRNLETIVDRAFAVSRSQPCGPVYLTLPKEPLCEAVPSPFEYNTTPRQQPNAPSVPSADAIDRAAMLISQAQRPILITAELGRYDGGPDALLQLVQKHPIPVIEHGKRNFFNFPTEHPMHLGFEPSQHVADADLVIVVESHVPWIPAAQKHSGKPPTVIQIAVDPLCQNIPMRSFPADLAVAGHPAAALRMLTAALDKLDRGAPAAKYKQIAAKHSQIVEQSRSAAASDGNKERITKRFLSYCIGQAIDDDTVIFNEYNLDPQLVPRHLPNSWFENSIASGLGWSLGAALGAQLAEPDLTMVVTLGDGTYLFNTPLSAHYTAAAYELPILIIVFNDTGWTTIKKSYYGTTNDPWGAKSDQVLPLTAFDIPIKFEMMAESCGGIGISEDQPGNLLNTLKKCLNLVRTGRKHVLLNVICEKDG